LLGPGCIVNKYREPADSDDPGQQFRREAGRYGNRPSIDSLLLMHTGGPGAPNEDAWLTTVYIGDLGLCYLDSVEIDELRYPIQVVRRGIEIDTEGAGTFCGAPAAVCEYGPTDAPIEAWFASDGSINAPLGVRGRTGGRSAQFKCQVDGTIVTVPPCGGVVLRRRRLRRRFGPQSGTGSAGRRRWPHKPGTRTHRLRSHFRFCWHSRYRRDGRLSVAAPRQLKLIGKRAKQECCDCAIEEAVRKIQLRDIHLQQFNRGSCRATPVLGSGQHGWAEVDTYDSGVRWVKREIPACADARIEQSTR
jgi:hypothetical protein